VIVLDEPLNVAVSCGSGTREDQVAVLHVVPAEQVVVTGVVKVIPEFPPQSPEFHEMTDKFQLPAPAPVMSWKSALVTVTVAAVIVLAVHRTYDFIRRRFITEFQVTVNVQVTIILLDNISDVVLSVVLASWLLVRLKNVNAHVIFTSVLLPKVTVFPFGSNVQFVNVQFRLLYMLLHVQSSAN